tara:strand:- start:2315 stop:2485 length:171 start_codon:yes stop_codon:yes gene_type:complete
MSKILRDKEECKQVWIKKSLVDLVDLEIAKEKIKGNKFNGVGEFIDKLIIKNVGAK